MKIAIINERWTAGATRCARDIEHGLAGRHDVRYFPGERRLTVQEQLAALKTFRPDVVHLHSFYGDLPYSFFAEVAQQYPTVLTPHDPRPIGDIALNCWGCEENQTCFKCPLVGQLKRYTLFRHEYYWRRLEKRRVHNRLPANTAIVCVSDWMRRRIMKTELSRLRVERIYNGIDINLYRRQSDARATLGLPSQAKIVTFAAHHSGWTADIRKGIQILACALEEIVVPRFPNLIVLAVGGGMIPNLPNIRPIGFVKPEEMVHYYSAADVFVAPSLADNLPYTVLEAMACEVPVVASRVGGIPEEIEDGKTGKLFTAGSWKELGGALTATLEKPTEASVMGKAGRNRVEKMFGLSDFIRKYESMFASVAGN